jgi:tetratricopeptide (TPR) repeat protein
MSKKTKMLILGLVCAYVGSLTAQKNLHKAEFLAANGEYKNAIEAYNLHLADQPNDYAAITKMADVYARDGQFGQSIYWYNTIPTNVELPAQAYISFGNTLKRVGRYTEAMEVYGRIAPDNVELSKKYMASCSYAIDMMARPATHDISVMPYNTDASDVALTYYKNAPIVSSYRNDVLMSDADKKLSGGTEGIKTYIIDARNKAKFIRVADNAINRVGPMSFTADGMTCAVIETSAQDELRYNLEHKTSALYIAKLNGKGEIISYVPFDHNEVVSSINAAHLAFDGTAIYFSSNRVGGYGGFDIYVSYMENGEWSLPVNLGETINTSGNEVTPCLHGDKLYFASDTHAGLGGYDVVMSSIANGEWTSPINPGNGFNSISDDYFPAVDLNGRVYLTSNRLGGRGRNDIYAINPITPASEPMMVVAVAPSVPTLATVDESTMPKAVSLEQLEKDAMAGQSEPQEAVLVSNTEPTIKVVNPENGSNNKKILDAKKVNMGYIALEGAYRVALEKKVPLGEVFFIQLASISASKPNFNQFRSLVKYGNIYKMLNNRVIKVRLGYFDSKTEAEAILAKVKASGYKDAFITFEMLNTAQMELILASTDDKSFKDEGNLNSKNVELAKQNTKGGSKYKVRLASYEDPTWFDIEKVKDLGRIEQWTKGGWTIFVLAGFSDLEEAKQAAMSANNRGYKTAEVVIDNGGILERLKQN